jgi:hypothetical protein
MAADRRSVGRSPCLWSGKGIIGKCKLDAQGNAYSLGLMDYKARLYDTLKHRNLVSLYRGKLFVGSHSAPLTWPSKEFYATSAYLF